MRRQTRRDRAALTVVFRGGDPKSGLRQTNAEHRLDLGNITCVDRAVGVMSERKVTALSGRPTHALACATLVSGTVTLLPLVVTIPPLKTPPIPTVAVPDMTCACGLPLTLMLVGNATTIT